MAKARGANLRKIAMKKRGITKDERPKVRDYTLRLDV